MVQLSHPYMTTGKTIALTKQNAVGKVMSMLFNMLPRFIIAFLLRSKHLLILWLQSPSSVILEPKKIKSVTVTIVSPSICHEVMGPNAMIFIFWMWSLNQILHSPIPCSSTGSLVSLQFLSWGWCLLHIWSSLYVPQQSWFQLVLHPVGHFTWCTLHVSYISKVTIYSLYVLLSQIGTSLLFYVQF